MFSLGVILGFLVVISLKEKVKEVSMGKVREMGKEKLVK